MSDVVIGRRGLAGIRRSLSERDMAIVESVERHRFLSARHIETLHFSSADGSQVARTRAARRALDRMQRERILLRLERRIGGVRMGSASFVYGLGPIGDRLLPSDGPRRRWREPSTAFLAHTLAIADLAVDLTAAHRQALLELVAIETEPTAWRRFNRGLSGAETLRPDLFVAIGAGEYEDRWFVEIDMATESTTTVLKKCRVYQEYHGSGIEQTRHGVFPKVLWIVPTTKRAEQLTRAIEGSPSLMPGLFEVVTADVALATLEGAGP